VRCQRCGNRIKELFIYKENEVICRKCIVYRRGTKIDEGSFQGRGDYNLNYSLTSSQNEASEFILKEIKNKRNCILKAVTGAGKTEIIYPLIRYCIDNKLKIGIVIPRKDVVIELYRRISDTFKLAKVTSLYGGSKNSTSGDIIILTSHQLYRYEKYFDVVVIDEVDAFPFYKNEILNNFLDRSVKGNIVYMSATIPESLMKQG